MRSNIARTCASGSVPERAPAAPATGDLLAALELPEVRHHGVELLGLVLLQRAEGRHGRRRVDERARDALGGEPVGDLREVWAGAAVAVLADLVAGKAARLGGHLLALLVLALLLGRQRRDPGGRRLLDLRRRPGLRTEE